MLRKHLVIVGGGWAGLSLVRSLKNVDSKKLRITLISDEPNFRYSPGLYRVATGYREREAIIPIGEVLGDIDHVDFVLDTAKKIDRKNRSITTTSGKTFHYDYAVLNLGMVTSYFGIPGVEDNAYTIKTTDGVRKFRTHLHQELVADNRPDKNYVVVGAGPTGVELSAALGSYLKRVTKWHKLRRTQISIELVEASSRIMPVVSPKISKKVHARLRRLGIKVMTNAKVQSESETSLVVNGRSIPTKTVIWTAGVTNNPFFKANGKQFTFNERGKIVVDGNLMIDNHTYVIGDNAATEYSGLALTAVHNAKYVAKDIKRTLHKLPHSKTYKPFKPATVIPVGSRWAVMQYRFIVITGLAGALLRSAADFIGYMDVLGFWKALEVWVSSNTQEEQCKICKSQLALQNGAPELLEAS